MDVFVKHDPRVFYVYGSCGGKLKKKELPEVVALLCVIYALGHVVLIVFLS